MNGHDYCSKFPVEVSVCHQLLWEAWGQFWNPEEGKNLLLEAITKGLVKRQQTEETQGVPQ
jgi:hypothetical protein